MDIDKTNTDFYFTSRQTEIDDDTVKQLCAAANISAVTASILVSRGITQPQQALRFLHYGAHNLHDPFLLDGMQDAVNLINQHKDRHSSVVVYGDYDADGICSVAILYLHLLKLGVNVNWYIPEREEGYGLSLDAIDFIEREYAPSLIITVDCGVTATKEAAYIRQKGIDLIVTDHHNRLPELPDCIIVNPKLSKNYPFSDLCGAGVAFKVVHALSGMEAALEYIDIAAIATIADSVELTGENRDIAGEGIRAMNTGLRQGLRHLCAVAGTQQGDIGAYTVAFMIVPRINAAGRIGEAKRALALFYMEDEQQLKELANELNLANAERQQLCESIMSSCQSKVEQSGADRLRLISVVDNSGQAGVSGIVASKLCERYYRPSFVFCHAEPGVLKGSGRSVEGINIFEMLSSMSNLFVRFGGHSYAAGVTILQKNYDEFVRRADQYLTDNRFKDMFTKKQYYDYDLSGREIDSGLVREMEAFEPCGVANPRPKFLYHARGVRAQALQKHPKHLNFKLSGVDVMAFNFGAHIDILGSSSDIKLLLEFKISRYAGREYAKGYLKDFSYGDTDAEMFRQKAAANYVLQLGTEAKQLPDFTIITPQQEKQFIQNHPQFGTLFVAFCLNTARQYLQGFPQLRQLPMCYFTAEGCSNATKLLVAPQPGYDMAGYNRVVFLDQPLSGAYMTAAGKGKELLVKDQPFGALPMCDSISLDREVFARYYKMLTDPIISAKPFVHMANLYYNIKKKYPSCQLLMLSVCAMVFTQLGFIKLNEDSPIAVADGQKSSLENSEIYAKLKKLLSC